MEKVDSMVKLAVNGGIGFGAKLTATQLSVIVEYLRDDAEIELTTFQQLYIEVPEEQLELIKNLQIQITEKNGL